jgi:hypothetical protein
LIESFFIESSNKLITYIFSHYTLPIILVASDKPELENTEALQPVMRPVAVVGFNKSTNMAESRMSERIE